MTNKELVIGFFMEGYVHHNYDFLMENMAADYFDNSPCAARPFVHVSQAHTVLTFMMFLQQEKESVLKRWKFSELQTD